MKRYTIALLLFVLLNLSDLILSCFLFSQHSQWAHESNPIANWFLSHLGFPGMTAFKIAIVGLTLVAVTRVRRDRPQLAQATLWTGCVILLAVVIHSVSLAQRLGDYSAHFAQQHEQRELLKRECELAKARQKLLTDYAQLVKQGSLSLSEAVNALKRQSVTDAGWRKSLNATFAHCSTEQQLAFVLCLHISSSLDDSTSQTSGVFEELERELAQHFSSSRQGWTRFQKLHWSGIRRARSATFH